MVDGDLLLHLAMEESNEGSSGRKPKVETRDWKTRRTSKHRIPGVGTNDAGQNQLLAALQEHRKGRRRSEGHKSERKETREGVNRARDAPVRWEKEHPGAEQRRNQDQISHTVDAKHRASARALEEKAMLYERLLNGEAENREEFNVDFGRKLETEEELEQDSVRSRDLKVEMGVQDPAVKPSDITKSSGKSSQQYANAILNSQPKAVLSLPEEDPFRVLAKEEQLWIAQAGAECTVDERRNLRRANIKSNFLRSYLAQARADMY